jgi:CRISPR-associated protein Cas5t
MLRVYLQAPFAAYRTFAAGWYRPTASFLTPSAAYGLLMNLAGIETRRDDGLSAMTVTAFDLPPARIALGAAGGILPTVQTVYQQLHNYPVGSSGKERAESTMGNKYNITPVRREVLVDLRAAIAVEAGEEIEGLIREGLSGRPAPGGPRYGIPFAGDNAFLLDRLEVDDPPRPAVWFRQIDRDEEAASDRRSVRLTVWIDRREMSRTRSALYAPSGEVTTEIPESAWTEIAPPLKPVAATKSKSRKKE